MTSESEEHVINRRLQVNEIGDGLGQKIHSGICQMASSPLNEVQLLNEMNCQMKAGQSIWDIKEEYHKQEKSGRIEDACSDS